MCKVCNFDHYKALYEKIPITDENGLLHLLPWQYDNPAQIEIAVTFLQTRKPHIKRELREAIDFYFSSVRVREVLGASKSGVRVGGVRIDEKHRGKGND